MGKLKLGHWVLAVIGVAFLAEGFLSVLPVAQAQAIRNTGTITSFPTKAAEIVPDDDVEFAQPSTIYVGGEGDVAVVPENNPSLIVVFKGIPAGGTVPVLVRRVMETDTTATDLVRIYQ